MIHALDLKNKNIFVTGADGFIGSHLVEKLVLLGANVRALCLYNSLGSIGWLSDFDRDILQNVDIVFGDIRDKALIAAQLQGFDYVFHLASLISIPHSYSASESYLSTNVIGLHNILETLKQQSVTRVINTSTSEVYGTALTTPINENHPLQAQSPYAASKIAADYLAQSYFKSFGLPVSSLRPFNTYGPRQSIRAVIPTIISQLLDHNQKDLKLGDLSPLRDFNYVEDTVSAFIHIMFNDEIGYGEAYNAGSGVSVSIEDTLNLIQNITGIGKTASVDSHKIRPKNSEVLELIADSEKFSKKTGWKPTFSLEDGLKETIDWFQRRDTPERLKGAFVRFD